MRVEDLERELRAERPEVEPEFARRLDEWAAAGFPRGGELDPRARTRGRRFRTSSPTLRRLWERVSAVPPRRLLAPVGAAATLIVVAGVAISQVPGDDEQPAGVPSTAQDLQREEGVAKVPPSPGDEATTMEAASGRAALGETAAPPAVADDLALESGGAAGVARGEENRLQDQTVRLSLGAETDEVQEVANGVVEVTDRYDGIVLNSQVTSDQAGARASFQLEIPAAKLDGALADLSELGDVISRTEQAEDITAQAVRARRELANTLDQAHDLRVALIEADTFEQKRVLRLRIRSLEATADALQTELNRVERQARFATVSVDVTSNGPASGSDDDGDWGLDDAVEDARDVLTTLGGIALVSLAILVPVTVLGAIAYWLIVTARRRSREKTLDA
jgi:hypothetical protein